MELRKREEEEQHEEEEEEEETENGVSVATRTINDVNRRRIDLL